MGELYSFLIQNNTTGIVITILLVLYLLINIYSDFEILKRLILNIIGLIPKLPRWIRKIFKNRYEKDLQSDEFQIFQKECLLAIYKPLVSKLKDLKYPIDIVSLKDLYDEDINYEAICIKNNKKLKYPFTGLFPKKNLTLKQPSTKKINKDTYDSIVLKDNTIPFKVRCLIKWYSSLMMTAIKFPIRIGYMLDDINFDENKNIIDASAHSNYYMSNIIDSHYLEYELYRYYKKYIKHNTLQSFIERCKDNNFKEEILNNLYIRNKIHKSFNNEEEVLISGKYRNTLLGVQAILLLKNRSNSYDVVSIRRSNDVVAKPGFIQFVPSGGFEALNDKDDLDTQRSNYSINKALFRELAEECFGLSEDIDWDNKSSETIYYQEGIKELLDLLNNNEKVEYEFLGTTMSLVSLRQEFSFILKIDDDSFIEKLVANYESNNTINLIDIVNLMDKDYWRSNKESYKYDDFKKINCTSAGLLELAYNNHIFKEIYKK